MSKIILLVVVVILGLGAWKMMGSSKMEQTPGAVTPPTTTKQLPANSASEEAEVIMKGFAFNPSTATVKAGTTVKFTNTDLASHSVTADDGSFESGTLGQNESTTITYDTPGTYSYHCTPHPNMKVSVVVE